MNVALKTNLSRVLQRCGILDLLEKRSTGNLVLTLHRILPNEELGDCHNHTLALDPGSFDELLSFITRRWTVVPLRKLLQEDQEVPNCRRLCAVTFDDGWEDNYRNAFPLLQRHGIAATIFIATGYIGTMRRMPEERMWRLWRGTKTHLEKRELVSRLHASVPGSENRENSLAYWQRLLKKLPHLAKLRLLDNLECQLGADPLKRHQFMTWEEVQKMQKSGITFESHTVNHVLLGMESEGTIDEELKQSKAVIAERLGTESEVIAFPSGSFDDRVQNAARENGYRAALSTIPGALRKNCNPFCIPRVAIASDVLNDTMGKFSTARAEMHFLRALRT